jgi:hypothetical protein
MWQTGLTQQPPKWFTPSTSSARDDSGRKAKPVRHKDMNPHDSDELAERIDEHFVMSIEYGSGVPAIERRGDRYRVYALEVFGAEEDQPGECCLEVSGTSVTLPADDFQSVLDAARSRPARRRPESSLKGDRNLAAMERAAHETWLAIGHRRWFAEIEEEPVLVWIDWDADESMYALHFGDTEVLVGADDLESIMTRAGF